MTKEKPTQDNGRYLPGEREPFWQKYWEKNEVYKFNPEKAGEIFSIDTPPPYVSAAHLHAGHVMSYTQAEFVVRYNRMKGNNVFYPMGFDDNGLPTERYVEKKYNIDKSKISKKEFIDLCLKETKIGGETYKKFFASLGISVDWSLLYSTISEHAQRIAQRSFIDLYKKEAVVRREEPVIWCPYCQTALAQSDLDDKEETSKLNHIAFKFEDGSDAIIATTRPELIPACVALFFHPEDERYQKYLGTKATVPLFNYQVPVIADESVDKNFGTGLMQVCTWGDTEDVDKWKRLKLKSRKVVEKDGTLSKLAGKYAGLKLDKAREAIINDLRQSGRLLKQEEITHVFNVHERCGHSTEFVVAPQWFIKTVENKEVWLKLGDELEWYPKFMKSRYVDWVNGLKWDWCISRQRYFGVPFPVWYCKNCNQIVLPEDKDLPVDPTESELKLKCPDCGSNELLPEVDVMDTWMTSSLTPLINAYWQYSDKNLMDKIYPMSLRVQAFEIIRTWLFSTVVKSHYHTGSLPWKKVMISGWGLDPKGKKISKSLGNYEDPETLVGKYSADALRFWSAGATLGQNLRYNEEEVKVGQKTVTKLWNAAKFSSLHLENYKYQPDTPKNLESADYWILNELHTTLENYQKNFDNYEYSLARASIDQFFWSKFADNYLEIVKYRLYGENEDSKATAQWTLYTCMLSIIKLYAPIMPFITEEIYQQYFKSQEKDLSIHSSRLPQLETSTINKETAEEFETVIKIIAAVRAYKSAKLYSIKKELKLLTVDGTINLDNYSNLLKAVLSFSKVEPGKGTIEISKYVKIDIEE